MATPKAPAKKAPAKRAPAKKPAAETAAPAEQVSGETAEEVKAQEAPPSPKPAAKETVKPEPKTPEKPKAATSEPLDPNDDEEGEIEIDGVWVTSKPKSFRRAGHRFTQEGLGIALHALQEGELEMLESEPNLVVERVTFTDVPLTKPKAD
ncbi:hypothetical protein [Neptuniibacter sp.]|uniref:hypothetical protein n=1 Tax=Neptuniibacter sp. TaxID=1962643 RepID=UPI003B5C12A9